MSVVLENQEVRVKGVVQGVGFRPTVYRLATECQLHGEVCNDSDGVLIRISGIRHQIQSFLQRLQTEAPPLAKIDSIQAAVVDAPWHYQNFSIGHSRHVDGHTEVTADAASCSACLSEMLNPQERRYLYPFTNCTHCGPRLSIIRGIPYDRPFTTMAAFPMCAACRAEYDNPLDRRFHAQPIACHDCGPRLSIHGEAELADAPIADVVPLPSHSAAATRTAQQLQRIIDTLRAGKIVAVKGLGGFHLCCDARNHQAVELLRQRKHRYAKPFALMSDDPDCIRQYCEVSELEEAQLTSVAAPIVLLATKAGSPARPDSHMASDSEPATTDASGRRRDSRVALAVPHEPRFSTTSRDAAENRSDNAPVAVNSANATPIPPLSAAIAPGSHLLGFMLPYTPLHSLILRQFGGPLVMTSGNLSGEPQIIDNAEAIEKLASIADLIVCHDRDIANRIDDSVVRCVNGRARLLRRARGYAPRSIPLPAGFAHAGPILAYGAELKSTFCLLKQGSAILSQHQGDLEDITTFDDYEHNLALYKKLFEFAPGHLALDLHPEYISGKLGRQDGVEHHVTASAVQHHHAHIASVMAENRMPLNAPPVLGIALDGLGFGGNEGDIEGDIKGNDEGKGAFWGGEFLLASYTGYTRIAHFRPVAMPGAAQAITQPWRNTVAHILTSMEWQSFQSQYGDTSLAAFLAQKPVDILLRMLGANVNSPKASSTGRLFDAVAGALEINAGQVQFEGQAAIELEMLADADAIFANTVPEPYRFEIHPAADAASHAAPLVLDAAPMWPALLGDLQKGVSRELIATRFHAGLINAILAMIERLAQRYAFDTVALSGGCMQNAILLQGLELALQARQYRCLTHALVPANDGGIALGQAVIAAACLIQAREGQTSVQTSNPQTSSNAVEMSNPATPDQAGLNNPSSTTHQKTEEIICA